MKMQLIRYAILAILFCFAGVKTKAQQTPESFVLETKYLLYLPPDYARDTSMRWPLLIFLHGSGESGNDLNKVKVHGPPKLIEQGKKFPFIVVSPQAPPKTGWRNEILKDMLDDLKKKYRVDTDRIYLTGLSMGGYGTWRFATEFRDEIAAIAPICGGGNPDEAWKLSHMPVWCFHGALDDVVPPSASQKMVDAIKKFNPSVKFTLYPNANHNSWDATYSNDSLYTWLLSQKKFRYKEITLPQQVVEKYTGLYVNSQNQDTVRVELQQNALVARVRNETIPLKASSEKNFFWDENSTGQVEFTTTGKNMVEGFILWADDRVRFNRVSNRQIQSGKSVR